MFNKSIAIFNLNVSRSKSEVIQEIKSLSDQRADKTNDGIVPKILVKNIPFEATQNDIFDLFKFINVFYK